MGLAESDYSVMFWESFLEFDNLQCIAHRTEFIKVKKYKL